MAKQPHLLVEEGDVHERVLLPGNPDRVDRIAAQCHDVTAISDNREYSLKNAKYNDHEITICSTGIGGPSTAIAIEELAKVGVTTLLRVGTTGALQPEIEIGDMIIATGAAKFEGTTQRYEDIAFPALPSHSVVRALRAKAKSQDETYYVGPLVTDDAFYNETEEFVTEWEDANMLAVEMEAATVFTIARRRNMTAGAICTVDGNLVKGTQKGADSDEELPPKARNNVKRAISIALETVTTL
ncbi:MAG: nucleoside phosphorylase [Halobacteriaceae archaeon]